MTYSLFRSLIVAMSLFMPLVSASYAVAEPVRKDAMVVEAPWARASIVTSLPSAAYLTIHNEGTSGDVLIGIQTSVAGKADVHTMTMTDGVARMGVAGAVEIPAGNKVELKPGGMHIMLMKLAQPLEKGKSFSMTLRFEKAGNITLTVPVLGIGATGPGE